MTLPVLRKLAELVAQGATVVGPKPEASPSLTGYPDCDDQVRRMADALWGNVDGKRVTSREVGKGRIVWGRNISEILREIAVAPDFEYAGATKDTRLAYIHRALDGADIYFVSNQGEQPAKADCTFRVSGRQPEIWDPLTGERRHATRFSEAGGRITVPIEFAPAQSWFVVFADPAGQARAGARNFPTYSPVANLSGPWEVRFDPRWGGPQSIQFTALEDWSKRPEETIKHYSGTVTYLKQFDIAASVLTSGQRVYLDLGQVRDIAELRLNDKHVAFVWTAPWHAEITRFARAGANHLEIRVANTWGNRLIGDKKLPVEKRVAWTTSDHYKEDTPLPESGLLGPVTVQVASYTNK